MPEIFNCLLIACPQCPYGVQLMFPQRPYTIHDALTAVKVDNKIYILKWCPLTHFVQTPFMETDMRILIRTARSTFLKVYTFFSEYGYTETDTPNSLWGFDPSGNLKYMYISKVFKQTSAYVQRASMVSQIIRLVITSFSNTDVTLSHVNHPLGLSFYPPWINCGTVL